VKTSSSDRAAAIFLALSRVPPDRHSRFLDEQCGNDDVLRRDVEDLLAQLDLPDSFLPAPESAPHIDDIGLSQPAGTAVGDFTLIRQIGSGGTGVVYLAHQRHPSRIVALKMLRREFMASSIQRRFEIEAELLGHLQHPGIAQIYAAHPGDATTPPFIAMELVNGPPLTEFADSGGLSVHERVELVARACDAVQHAHQRGIIHRDLKPGNILVSDDGQPKVLDFGVARRAGAQVMLTTVETETGQLLGTLAYMSPEQIEAAPEAIDTRTDIHALGVILFRMLVGRLPFGHDDPPIPELARRIVSDDPPRLSAIDPSLRGDLEVIVARAMAKEKDRRYASAASLATDLRRYLAGQPISASADSAWYVVRRQLGRYRLAFSLSAAVGVALAGLAFYASVQRARVDLVNAEVQRQLSASTLERARLLSVTGNLPIAEELAWRELFRNPASRQAQWTLWEIYSREPSLRALTPHQGGVLTVRFSPDNRLLLTAGQTDGFMRLVDVESGRVVRSLTATPGIGTRRAFFTPDGSTIVSGSKSGTLQVWDVQTGALRREIVNAVPSLEDLAIAAGGTQAVTVAPGGVLQTWSLATGQLMTDLSQLAPGAAVVAADPAGTLVLAGAPDGVVTAIDIARRTRLWQARAHESAAISLAIAPDARTIASGGLDARVHLRKAATGELLRTIATENGSVRNLTFDWNGAMLAATGQWRTLLWDLGDSSRPPRSFGGAEGVTDLHVRPDTQFLVTCDGGSGLVRLWDLAADARSDRWAGHRGAVTGVAVGAEGKAIFSGGVDGDVAMWQPGQQTRSLSLRSGDRVGGIAISDNKRWIVSVGHPGTAAVWDARNGGRVADLGDAGASRAAVFSNGDRQLVIGDIDGALTMWDWSDGMARNARRIEPPSTPNEVLALASHGSRLFVAHRETLIIIRDAANGREIRRLQPTASPFSVAVTPDGRLLAAGTWPGIVDLWEIETGRKLHALKGPTALVTGLDFSADGGLLALSSRDGSTRLWAVADGHWLATFASRRPGAERVRFFPDGRRLAIGYADGEVEIRDLPYFFRYAAGHAEYHLRRLSAAGESFPRANEALAWSRRFMSVPADDGGSPSNHR
jgi:WD40 repeat protein/predicted Ser/Thr protein kinase